MRISEAFDLYKNNYMFIKGLSRRLLENQDYVKNRLVKILGDIEIENLTMDHVNKWVDAISYMTMPDGAIKKRAANTMRNDIIRLKMVLRYMKLIEVKCINPELIPVPKREDVTRPFLTSTEVAMMIDNAYNLRNKAVISLLYSSGIRLSELISLNRDSITNKQFSVVGKGKKARLCFIDDRTEYLLNEYLATRTDDSPALIVSYKNKDRMTPTNVQLLIKNSAKRAGIDKKVTPHILRHSFATNYIKNNGNIRHLSVLMGHASINTTAIYAHVVDNELEEQYKKFHTI